MIPMDLSANCEGWITDYYNDLTIRLRDPLTCLTRDHQRLNLPMFQKKRTPFWIVLYYFGNYDS